MEMYVLALLTAFTLSVMIGLRVGMKVQESSATHPLMRAAVLDDHRPIATAGLAVLLAVGIGAPIVLLSLVWDVLRPI